MLPMTLAEPMHLTELEVWQLKGLDGDVHRIGLQMARYQAALRELELERDKAAARATAYLSQLAATYGFPFDPTQAFSLDDTTGTLTLVSPPPDRP